MGIATVAKLLMYPDSIGFDARLYQRAAQSMLTGRDPWAQLVIGGSEPIAFAGPPITLLPFVATAWIPADWLVGIMLSSSLATAVWLLRRLQLPLWWLLFPPLIQAILVGNLNVFVVALLVAGHPVAIALATILKVYAAVPAAFVSNWRGLMLAGLFVAVSGPFLPWGEYIDRFAEVTGTLSAQSWDGRTNVLTSPLAWIGSCAGLALLGRGRTAWLAVPVLWPATQLHYAVLILPVVSVPLAVAASVPEPGMLGLGVMLLALAERRSTIRRFPGLLRSRLASPGSHARIRTLDE